MSYTHRGWTTLKEAQSEAKTMLDIRGRTATIYQQQTGEFLVLDGGPRSKANSAAQKRHGWKTIEVVSRSQRNPARNLAKSRTIGQKSQRGRRDPKTGRFTQKASARLMARRKKDTIPGYFPNPGEEMFFPNPAVENAAAMLNKNIREYIRKIPREHGAEKQACVSFAQGLIEAGHIVGIFNHDEKKTWLSLLKTSIG